MGRLTVTGQTVNRLLLVLLLLSAPLSWLARWLGWGDLSVFLSAILAIIPLAVGLSSATEKISAALGPNAGALLSAVFGNGAELIILLTTLRAGLVDVVKASITGTVIANLLLGLGLSMLIGGVGRSEQRFQPLVARVNGTAMTLAVLAILIPSLSGFSGPMAGSDVAGQEAFSRFVAWVLLITYLLTLLFSLRTHRTLWSVSEADLAEPGLQGKREAEDTPEADHQEQGRPALLLWVAALAGSTAGLALESELFVGALEPVTQDLGLSTAFTGVVLLPFLGCVSEFLTAIRLARRNRMDVSVAVLLGSTLLLALLVVPVLVLVGPALGHPLDLRFDVYELVAVATAVVVSNLASIDGRSDWLEGALLLAAYVILAAGFWFQAMPAV